MPWKRKEVSLRKKTTISIDGRSDEVKSHVMTQRFEMENVKQELTMLRLKVEKLDTENSHLKVEMEKKQNSK